MSVKVGVVQFPGSNDDRDALWALERVGADPVLLWHGDASLQGVDAVLLPGGFSYGDYLRCGAIARFAPVMEHVIEFARAGGPVLGICNGFQILCEAGLLPGALARNVGLRFICRNESLTLRTERTWIDGASGDRLRIPVKHGEGRYVVDEPKRLWDNDQVVLTYDDNPNGSIDEIAGVCNEAGNVVGMMPHPEHAVDAALGFKTEDGRGIIAGLAKATEAVGA